MKEKIMKILLVILVVVLMSYFVNAVVVPSGDSVEVRGVSDWDLNEVDGKLVNQKPDPAEPGGFVELRFKVENIGADYAKDIIFELEERYPFSLYDTSAIRKLGNLHMSQAGEDAYLLYYKLRVDKDAIDGNNMIRLKYSVDGGLTWSINKFLVRIQSYDAVLSVDSVRYEPEEAGPGSVAMIILELNNKADSLLKDIKVNLGVVTRTATATSITTEELPFTPLGSTNEKTIGYIDGHNSEEVAFKLVVDADAESKIYKLPITLTYSDGVNTNYTRTYYTSFIVGEQPDIVTTIDDSEIISAEQAGTVTVKFTNKGVSDLKFLYIELIESENYDIISPASVYVGNIDSDDYESADFNLYVKKSKENNLQLPLRLEYRDANNKMFKKDVILRLNLYSSSEAEKYGLVQSNGYSGFIYLLIIAGAGYFFYKRWKKKKKENKK